MQTEIALVCAKWEWCMDYCKINCIPPAQEWAWNKASIAYLNMLEDENKLKILRREFEKTNPNL